MDSLDKPETNQKSILGLLIPAEHHAEHPMDMETLPQTSLEFWRCFMKTRYALHGFRLALNRSHHDGHIAQVIECPSLQTLDLSNCNGVTDMSALGQCVSLHILNLTSCIGVANVSSWGQCASLLWLSLTGCVGAVDGNPQVEAQVDCCLDSEVIRLKRTHN